MFGKLSHPTPPRLDATPEEWEQYSRAQCDQFGFEVTIIKAVVALAWILVLATAVLMVAARV